MFKRILASLCVFILISLELFTLYRTVDTVNYRWGIIFFLQLPYVVYFILLQIFKFKEPDPPYRVLLPITLFGVFYSAMTLLQFPNFYNTSTLLVSSSYAGVMATLAWYVPKLPIDKDNPAIKVGAKMPELVLEDHHQNPIPLSALNNQPNLYIFYRGNWCVFCVAQLNQIVGMYKKIEDTGIRVVLVSPQKMEDTQSIAKKHNVNFTYLVDKDLKLADTLGIRHKNGAPKSASGIDTDTVFPTLIFCNEKGKILYSEQTDNFRYRPDPHRYLTIINQLKLQDFFESKVEERTKELDQERAKSEKLLLNILPQHVAVELKETGKTSPAYYEKTSVMFTDFKGFTQTTEKLDPKLLISELDSMFSVFDKIINEHKLEKIKTIGDAYMAVGGVPLHNQTNPIDAVLAGLKMQAEMKRQNEIRQQEGRPTFELRLGIHTGSLIAGVIGTQKFCYDVWGDTVNLASRMESSGEPYKVNISQSTFDEVKNFFECEHRGKVSAKNKGEVDMYFVQEIKSEFLVPGQTFTLNDAFKRRYLNIEKN